VSDSDAESVVLHHLFAPVGDVRTHHGQPFQRRKALGCLAVPGCINDRPLLIQVLHTLLKEGRPNDVAGHVLHGRIIFWRYTVAAEDMEGGMPLCCEHGNHLLRDLSPVQECPEHLMPEDSLQLFQLQGRDDAEHAAITMKMAVGHQDVAVWIESEKIPEGLSRGILRYSCAYLSLTIFLIVVAIEH